MESSNINIAAIRKDYTLKSFSESDLLKNPFEQFRVWFTEAIHAEVNEPNAMTLATVKPELEDDCFVFFTNYSSNKGQQIGVNNKVALVFFWPELERQVRIEGIAEKLEEYKSDDYFKSRPMSSQIGAHASPQSLEIENRQYLEDLVVKMEELFSDQPIVRPNFWGGFKVIAHSFEFWQGRSSRLHDRFIFRKSNNEWLRKRLAP
ncbi:MAG: pyridoxamine 5'-phosphate oxidase [Bacteroidetes bacterium]|nr:pyridoxamine 5'-phosphate oxidase [Bacteroidota bacterium]